MRTKALQAWPDDTTALSLGRRIRYDFQVRRFPVLFAAFLLTRLVFAQSDDWTTYLSGADRAAASEARDLIADRMDVQRQRTVRYQMLEALYAEARAEVLAYAEYVQALEESGVGEDPGSGPAAAARATISSIFRDTPPLSGTAAEASARAWLGELAEHESFPAGLFLSRIDAFERSLESLSRTEAGRLTASLAETDTGVTFLDDLSTHDASRELVSRFALRLLAASPQERADLLVSFMQALDASGMSRIAGEFALLTNVPQAGSPPRPAYAPSARALGVVLPTVFAEADSFPQLASGFAELGDAVRALVSAAPAEVADVPAAEVGFLVDTLHRLLSHMSDLQRYALSRAMAMSPGELTSAYHRLYQIRRIAARLPEELASLAAPAIREGAVYQSFLAEGETLLAAARPWVDGERSRSGDAYRWAILPIVSHPYAQYLLGSRPELADAGEMVDSFVTRTYSAALRRLEDAGATVAPVSVAGLLPYHRTYAVDNDATAEMLYQAFVAEAQGADVAREFARPFAAGLTLAGYWSHMHGLHAAIDPGDGASLVRARVDDWFALGSVAETVVEERTLLVYGVVSLRRAILDEVESAAVSGALGLVAPRLSVALALLEQAAHFRADPLEVVELLTLLYDAHAIGHAIAAIADETHRVARRLQSDRDDRRLVVQAAVAGRVNR